MYVTRLLSLYKKYPNYVSAPPPEGPNSGYLVVQDEESKTPCCFGLCKSDYINDLPLPSNKILRLNDYDSDDEIFAIPVINHPLSSNKYYAIKADFTHKGLAYVSSRKKLKRVCCCGSSIRDEKPTPLDPENIYQKFEFSKTTDTKGFSISAKSAAPGSHPPRFLRRSKLNIRTSYRRRTKDFIKGEANGMNSSLRARLPDFNFSLSQEISESVCVGNWYCPFMFIHDGKLKDQVKNSVYYELRLEQHWERIFSCESSNNKVVMNVVVPTEVVYVGGKEAVRDERNEDNQVVRFRTNESRGKKGSVGLSSVIIDRMIWEEERFGWISGEDRQVRLFREEEYRGNERRGRFGCYVLVERYLLKRTNGKLVMSYDFKHANQIRIKWE